MRGQQGFTLIEVILFIVILGVLASTILLASISALKNTPALHQGLIANQLANQCMEWFKGQRQLNGFSSLTCPSTPSPALCSTLTGFTVTSSISCTAINGDSNYKTITVTVSGLGNATLSTLIAGY